MKKRLLNLTMFMTVLFGHVNAQEMDWSWEGGYGEVSGIGTGVWGTKGVTDANNIPSPRNNAATWKDSSGNLWLFGGEGRDFDGNYGSMNDLWQFDGTNWTWISGSKYRYQTGVYGSKGVSSASNMPGSRSKMVTWVDSSNNLWLFGGRGSGVGVFFDLNDLWKFDGVNWTWVAGTNTQWDNGSYGTKGVASASNRPPATSAATGWMDDSGNLILFGGLINTDFRNDLWKFDGTNWTWIGGSNTSGSSGVYGTKGLASASNMPGARHSAINWKDSSGDVWLFGGYGHDAQGTIVRFNDLWKFDGTQWTWVSGNNTGDGVAIYGTKGAANVNNVPGGRTEAAVWIDSNDNAWLFGGYGNDADSQTGFLDDFWKYDGVEWTWVAGSNIKGATSVFGNLSTPDPSNTPGGRSGSAYWLDNDGKIWVFGGFTSRRDNDIWNCNFKWFLDNDNDQYGAIASSLYGNSVSPTGYVGNSDDCDDSNADINPGTTWYADADGDGYGDEGITLTQCDQPAGYVINGTDCDDTDSSINPTTIWYADADGDGYGDSGATLVQCTQPTGYVINSTDCDDTDSSINPTTMWYVDADGDGYGDAGTTLTQCSQPTGYVANHADCDDTNASVIPITWYLDADADGYGDPSTTLAQCTQPAGYVANNADCDDTDPSINPTTTWYGDADGDGYGDAGTTLTQCTQPTGYVTDDTDCDDTDSSINPATIWYADTDGDGYGDTGATLVQCTQPTGYVTDDTDCVDTDSSINPTTIWYADADGDGYGDSGTTLTQCTQPSGYVANNTDCDDADVSTNPTTIWYADTDGDGYGDAGTTLTQCTQPTGYVLDDADCDDSDSAINSGDLWYLDSDGDGYGDAGTTIIQCDQPAGYVDNSTDCDDTDKDVYPSAPGLPDGKDNDCDGTVDKGDQVITFNAIEDQIIQQERIDLVATSSSGLDVAFEVVSGPASLSGKTLTLNGLGTVEILATQSGNDNYLAATPVAQTFDIITVTSVVGIDQSEIYVYPNPTSEYLMISINDDILDVYVMDLSGKAVLNSKTDTINVSSLENASYIIMVNGKNGTYTRRFVKQ